MATSIKDEAFVICFRSNTPSNYQFGNFTMYFNMQQIKYCNNNSQNQNVIYCK
jgi:hypothetical protein